MPMIPTISQGNSWLETMPWREEVWIEGYSELEMNSEEAGAKDKLYYVLEV